MFRTGSPEESRMLLRELSETALLLLFSLDCCGPTTITTSSDDTSDCLVGVAYGLGGGEGRGGERRGPDTLQCAHTSDSLMASYLEAATGSPVSW